MTDEQLGGDVLGRVIINEQLAPLRKRTAVRFRGKAD